MMMRFIGRSVPLPVHTFALLCKRRLSTHEAVKPLFLFFGEGDHHEQQSLPRSPRRLLLPLEKPQDRPTVPTVRAAEDVRQAVNQHYQSESYFVGGMGESDPGVRFATTADCPFDTLDFAELIGQSIELVRMERHGVPFGLYTTGIASSQQITLLEELGLDVIEVSLFAANPPDYHKATGATQAQKDFGQVCGFIAQAAEQNLPVEVGVLQPYASAARDLALSLGARQVHVYQEA